MATDYDTPRKQDEELHEESLEELKARRADAQSGQVDIDEEEAAEKLKEIDRKKLEDKKANTQELINSISDSILSVNIDFLF